MESDYRKYLRSPQWKAKCDQVWKRAKAKCERCGAYWRDIKPDKMNVHHLNYDSLGDEDLDDLQLLCRDCHKWEHGIGEYDPCNWEEKMLYMLRKL